MADAGLNHAVKGDVGIGITGSLTREDPSNPNSQPGKVYIASIYRGNKHSSTLEFNDNKSRAESKKIVINKSLEILLDMFR
jgi:nicotinamide mononucleotide (NMN) deamidase PncC